VHGKVDLTGQAGNTVDERSRAPAEPGLGTLLLMTVEAVIYARKRIYFRPWTYDIDDTDIAVSLKQMMQAWCPSEWNLMSLTFDNTSTYFVNQLERPDASHVACNTSRCSAFDLGVEIYTPAHSPPCQVCENITIDNSQLEDLLMDAHNISRILISYSDPPTVSFVTHGPYVAIFHVWYQELAPDCWRRVRT
jgi:hypothetical protein